MKWLSWGKCQCGSGGTSACCRALSRCRLSRHTPTSGSPEGSSVAKKAGSWMSQGRSPRPYTQVSWASWSAKRSRNLTACHPRSSILVQVRGAHFLGCQLGWRGGASLCIRVQVEYRSEVVIGLQGWILSLQWREFHLWASIWGTF